MTTLGAPIVVRTVEQPCNGECGGTIVLTTDEVYAAYAITVEPSVRFIEQDGTVSIDEDGTITANCASYHTLREETCSGFATFDKGVLNAEPWVANAEHRAFMTPMERA